MPTITGLLKRARSKSEKTQTPPKVVFGDLGSAYASIAQKGTPSTPNLCRIVSDRTASPIETIANSSPMRSPQSDASTSPSAPLLQQLSPDTAVHVSHLPGDPFVSKTSASSSIVNQHAINQCDISMKDENSMAALDFKKQLLGSHFGIAHDEATYTSSSNHLSHSTDGRKLLSSREYPELQVEQLEACSKLAGTDGVDLNGAQPLDRCATIRSIASRHEYGKVGTNDDIRSLRVSHIQGTSDLNKEIEQPRNGEQGHVHQVEWSPRPSSELYMLANAKDHDKHFARRPPTMPLPQTPKGKGLSRYGELTGLSSSADRGSRSSESYGNTRRLLELSSPQITQNASKGEDFFDSLKKFAKEGPSSSSCGGSSKSFATLSIKEANGITLTRPVSLGEFQYLENAISSRFRPEGRTGNQTLEGSLLHVGLISLDLPEGSTASLGPGSSQTTSSHELDSKVDFGVIQPALRTRNGTPPLLFGVANDPKRDADWETVPESNQTTSSVADYSDSASRSPSKSLLSVEPAKIFRRPSHPRYNHSWDLQQDLRSGAYVLTPRNNISGGASFPNNQSTALAPLHLIGTRNYSHPTPLPGNHSHPFTSSAPPIRPSHGAQSQESAQRDDVYNTHRAVASQGSSAWFTATEAPTSRAATSLEEARTPSASIKAPPLPSKNPYRQQKKFVSEEHIELQNFLDSASGSRLDDIRKSSSKVGLTSSTTRPGFGAEGAVPSTSVAHPFDPFADGLTSQGPVSRGVSSGAISISSYATTDEGALSTMSGRQSTVPGMAQPADAIVADTITPPQRKAEKNRHMSRRYAPMPHPVYGLASRGTDLLHLRKRELNPAPPPTYEQRVARRYLKVCTCLPFLLPVYATGCLDFLIRYHTHGQAVQFPEWEKRAAWGLLAAWGTVVLCVVPFCTFLHEY